MALHAHDSRPRPSPWGPAAEVVEAACGIAPMMMGEMVENVAQGIDCYSIRQPLGVGGWVAGSACAIVCTAMCTAICGSSSYVLTCVLPCVLPCALPDILPCVLPCALPDVLSFILPGVLLYVLPCVLPHILPLMAGGCTATCTAMYCLPCFAMCIVLSFLL